MTATSRDLEQLQAGQPPFDERLLDAMTEGRALWLDRFQSHYLAGYILSGGSKVKVLVGDEGSGKTHLIHCALSDARRLGYETAYVSAREERKLNDVPSLYRSIAGQIRQREFVQGLCRRVAERLGYGAERYDGESNLVSLMVEDEHIQRTEALRLIRTTTGELLHDEDLSPSFVAFVYAVVAAQLAGTVSAELVSTAMKWLSGEKLARFEKQSTNLFERLQKTNARTWLNGLVRLLKLAGKKGLVVALDDLEVITERDPRTNAYRYTPSAVKDTCELIRQLIDDAELLESFVLLIAGRPGILREDERRSLRSYEALWMRLQSGLVPTGAFNPFNDIVDVDRHLEECGEEFASSVAQRLEASLQADGFVADDEADPMTTPMWSLRDRVVDMACRFRTPDR
jgi:hypothetical protein